MVKSNSKLYKSVWIWVIIGLFIMVYTNPHPNNKGVQSIVSYGQCFENEDCKRPPKFHFCDVYYECVSGKCVSADIACIEVCNDGADNDFDGAYDCDDSDCFNSPSCPCSSASFSKCEVGRCYCPDSMKPHWTIYEGGNACVCIN